MKLKEKSLYNKKETITIPRTKFIIGIASGFLFAFWLYAFLYMSREVFRFFSQTEYYDLLILSDREVFFYNLFFAFIAVIFGQSVCFNYWFEKPRNLFQRNNWRRISIVNDNRVLNWYFLSWFSKIAVAYGLLFCFTYGGGNKYFNFYPDYIYLFILIVVVLYLQVWKTFRITFKKESKKWFLISVIAVTGVSFTFSMINFVDHKALDESLLKKNVFLKYNLEIPDSDYYIFGVERMSLTEKIFVAMAGHDISSLKPLIIYENEEIAIHNIDSLVSEWRKRRSPVEAVLIDVRLYIDKNVLMGFVNDLKEELSGSNSRRVSFIVFPTDLEVERPFNYYYSLPFILPPPGEDRRALADSLTKADNISNVINIRADNLGQFYFNGLAIGKKDLAAEIEKKLRTDIRSAFLFAYSEATAYADFIYAISQIRKATNNIRNEFVLKEYKVSLDDLRYSEEFYEFIDKYPALLFNFVEN